MPNLWEVDSDNLRQLSRLLFLSRLCIRGISSHLLLDIKLFVIFFLILLSGSCVFAVGLYRVVYPYYGVSFLSYLWIARRLTGQTHDEVNRGPALVSWVGSSQWIQRRPG